MTLALLLNERLIIPELAARDRLTAIDELADRVFTETNLPEPDRATIRRRLLERETRFTTGIGGGVAIPHALCPHATEVVSVFGRSSEGIDFKSIDGAPVHFIVLFIVPERKYRLRLETLSAIGKTLSRATLRDRLRRAESAAEIISLLEGRPASGMGKSGSVPLEIKVEPPATSA